MITRLKKHGHHAAKKVIGKVRALPKFLAKLKSKLGKRHRSQLLEAQMEPHHVEVSSDRLSLGFVVYWHNRGEHSVTVEDAYVIVRKNRLDENGTVFRFSSRFTQHEFRRSITKIPEFRPIVVAPDGLVKTQLRFTSREIRQVSEEKILLELVAISNQERFFLQHQPAQIPRRIYYRTSERWEHDQAA